ncbi:type VII secretion AAA-ATPase EccA [Mycobacterium koreense]|uniref:Type VII secretion AAA-ATPase EccA n=1 Tax=Mycolicibacillus koreensis TaxID=1069220 RepID=A0AA91SQN2_9MYCO|nr:type VII secretion AAA-ATPase EccA [Mycolicibacillus koreensis]OSC31909.1 type VII secretion AAA-ATPase EccA [Mycolicibacillus koreensis]
MIDRDAIDLFTRSCANLGATVFGRTQIPDLRMARDGFMRLTGRYAEQCDGWRGLAAAGETSRDVLENAYRSLETFGELLTSSDVAEDALNFVFDSGLYINLPAIGSDGVLLACAAARAHAGEYESAHTLLDNRLLSAHPAWAGWVLAVVYWRAARWHDVRRVLSGIRLDTSDVYLRQAVAVAYGIAGAYLGLWEQAFELLHSEGRGPVPAATAEALLIAALCARVLDRQQESAALLNEAYAVNDVSDAVRSRIANALSDPDFGILATTAARIDARSDYWDPATEPGEREHTRQLGAERREQLKAEATRELDAFVGMVDVKDQIAKLESSVRAAKRRKDLGMPANNRSLHLVLKGPPGVGKTTIARVIGKLLCAADVLPSDTFIEAGRGDLLDKVIGGSEAKILNIMRSIIDSGGGVLFIDEAYTLTDSGSKNDFGPLVIGELIRYMVDYADVLMVIVAGYADKMDEFLDSNEGLRSRFGREIELPSYTAAELVEITERAAARRGSVVADSAALTTIYHQLSTAIVSDTGGRQRCALDVAGNGRFANTLLERAEEERDHRLDISGALDDPDASAESLQTITAADIDAAATLLLRKQRITLAAESAAEARR